VNECLLPCQSQTAGMVPGLCTGMQAGLPAQEWPNHRCSMRGQEEGKVLQRSSRSHASTNCLKGEEAGCRRKRR